MPDNNNTPEIVGYLNWAELQSAILRGLGMQSFVAILIAILLSVADSANLIYTGPQAAVIVWIASSLAGYLRSQQMARKLISQGSEIEIERKP